MSGPQYRTVAFRIMPTVIAELSDRVAGVETDVQQRVSQAAFDSAIASKADTADLSIYATIADVSGQLADKADASALSAKADASALSAKADAADLAALDTRVGIVESALPGKADAAALTTVSETVAALNQAAEILVGAEGAFQIPELPGSSNVFVYDGTVQALE